MPRPEVVTINPDLIPEGSMAVSAAEVLLYDGQKRVIELFQSSGDHGYSFDFRGLPDHLGDSDTMSIDTPEPIVIECDYEVTRQRQERLLFEFAIGARQSLWPGAEARYADESYDPTSRHYKAIR